MTIEEAYNLIENLDYPEGLKRKFAPRFSLVQIDKLGEIACVQRYKSRPTEADQLALLKQFPKTVQINGEPGLYSSVDALKQNVKDSMWLFEKFKDKPK